MYVILYHDDENQQAGTFTPDIFKTYADAVDALESKLNMLLNSGDDDAYINEWQRVTTNGNEYHEKGASVSYNDITGNHAGRAPGLTVYYCFTYDYNTKVILTIAAVHDDNGALQDGGEF